MRDEDNLSETGQNCQWWAPLLISTTLTLPSGGCRGRGGVGGVCKGEWPLGICAAGAERPPPSEKCASVLWTPRER